jgi:hypothetical protein
MRSWLSSIVCSRETSIPKSGLDLVQVVEGEPGQLGHLDDQLAVDLRLLKGRVGEQDQHARHTSLRTSCWVISCFPEKFLNLVAPALPCHRAVRLRHTLANDTRDDALLIGYTAPSVSSLTSD